MNVVSPSGGVQTHGAHRAISYVSTLGGASRRTFFFADVSRYAGLLLGERTVLYGCRWHNY